MSESDLEQEIEILKEDKKQLEKIAWVRTEERNEARRQAEQIRDLYAAEIDESVKAFPFPWEYIDGSKRILHSH